MQAHDLANCFLNTSLQIDRASASLSDEEYFKLFYQYEEDDELNLDVYEETISFEDDFTLINTSSEDEDLWSLSDGKESTLLYDNYTYDYNDDYSYYYSNYYSYPCITKDYIRIMIKKSVNQLNSFLPS